MNTTLSQMLGRAENELALLRLGLEQLKVSLDCYNESRDEVDFMLLRTHNRYCLKKIEDYFNATRITFPFPLGIENTNQNTNKNRN